MNSTVFVKGQKVIVTTKNGKIEGTISDVNTNICTWETEFSVEYMKDGNLWTMIGIPAKAIELV